MRSVEEESRLDAVARKIVELRLSDWHLRSVLYRFLPPGEAAPMGRWSCARKLAEHGMDADAVLTALS